ncbi:unnamed protein product [Acanthoscelides obtectus]|uniref:Uncharacterized protein n=1 Tax=Acanthoscelides obtectus TaxID=200917 RepID=A0A9P0MD38_ACAOB|nr:unnamed protein product [Acanthoscelides obtectus]CAK1669433.1 hypothetical protein AOBTE_LOCUS27004 [Acanthoscelides obtectus]
MHIAIRYESVYKAVAMSRASSNLREFSCCL